MMSNFQNLVYFKHIILEELENYQTADNNLKEIYLRNIISRLYYTCMHLCIEKFNIEIDENERTHEQVLNQVPKGIKQKLKSLKSLRVKADYKKETFFFPLSTKGRSGISLSTTEQITQLLEFFENLGV